MCRVSSRSLEGQPYKPDAIFFAVVCGSTHADSPRAFRHSSGQLAAPITAGYGWREKGRLQAMVAPRSSRAKSIVSRRRSDGSPRSESGKPARHMGTIAFILGSEALAERRLLIGNDDN